MATLLNPFLRADDANGNPVSGGQLAVFLAGTTTPVTTYSDRALTTAQARPLIANSAGEFAQSFVASGIYKIRVSDADGVTLYENDNVRIADRPDDPVSLDDVAAVLADTGAYAEGTYILTQKEGFVYQVAASGATDQHVTTAGGVKLYVLPGERGYHVDAFGAAGDGTTNDTTAIQAAAAAAGDGEAFTFNGDKSYVLQGVVDTAGSTLGKKCYLNGATLLLNDNAATIKIGQQGSGLFLDGGTIRAQSGFTGTAVTVTPQARSTSAARSVYLNHGSIFCATATGKAVDMTVDTAETRIVGLRSFGLTITGFEFGVDLNSDAPSGVGFVNDNEFHGLRLPFNTANGVRLQASASGTNETSGNMFVGLMTQWVSGVTVKSINVADTRCKRNKFISVETWDISGASGVSEVVTDLGTSTMWLGSVPSSGGVSSLSPSAIGMRTKDAGSQLAELLLGDYVRSNSVERRKIQTFDTADLTILDVRDGDIMIEGTVASGTRLTNIIQGGTGQIITIIFGGNTLLSNEWGGVGDIKLKNGGSRYPAPNEVCQFVYNGTDWIELGGKDEQLTSAVAGAISNVANAINTTGKFTGKLVWDTTNNRMLRASGASASSVWHVVDGSASVTPA